MMKRRPVITEGELQFMVHQINTRAGTPVTTHANGDACVGNYHLSFAYGGVALHQTLSKGGSVRDVFGRGHMPKRDLYNLLYGFTPDEVTNS